MEKYRSLDAYQAVEKISQKIKTMEFALPVIHRECVESDDFSDYNDLKAAIVELKGERADLCAGMIKRTFEYKMAKLKRDDQRAGREIESAMLVRQGHKISLEVLPKEAKKLVFAHLEGADAVIYIEGDDFYTDTKVVPSSIIWKEKDHDEI